MLLINVLLDRRDITLDFDRRDITLDFDIKIGLVESILVLITE